MHVLRNAPFPEQEESENVFFSKRNKPVSPVTFREGMLNLDLSALDWELIKVALQQRFSQPKASITAISLEYAGFVYADRAYAVTIGYGRGRNAGKARVTLVPGTRRFRNRGQRYFKISGVSELSH